MGSIRVVILILLTFFGALNLFAQEIQWSNPTKFRGRTAYTRIIGENQDGIFVLRCRNRTFSNKVVIERYRHSLGLDYSKTLGGLKQFGAEKAFITAEGFVIIKSKYDRERDASALYIGHYDREANPIGADTLIDLAKEFINNGTWAIEQSANRKYLGIAYIERNSKNKLVLRIKVIDANQNVISESRSETDLSASQYKIDQLIVSPDGNAYVRIENVLARTRDIGPFPYQYKIFRLGHDREEAEILPINPARGFLNELYMTINFKSKELIVVGLQSEKEGNTSKSVELFRFSDTDGKLIKQGNLIYSYEMVSDLIGSRGADKGEEAVDLEIRKIVCAEDGSIILIGEEFYLTQQTYSLVTGGWTQVNTRSIFNYGKIIIMGIDENFNPIYDRVIKKSHSTIADEGFYSSLFVGVRNNEIDLYFNDKLSGAGDLFKYTLDKSGKLEYESVFSNQGSFISIIPSECLQLSSNSFLFPTSKDRKFAFFKYTW